MTPRLLVTMLVGLIALLALPAGAMAKRGDRDHDRLPDRWEKKHRAPSATADLDDDGLSNLGEYRSGTKPRNPDTDNDATGDGDEDRDGDQVDNGNEIRERTNPRRKDSDGDRRRDGAEDADRDRLDNAAEDATGNDPIDPDTDGDGIKDGKETVGRVVSFEDGLLTLRLAGGRTVEGVVDDATDVACESDDSWMRDDEDDDFDDEDSVDADDDGDIDDEPVDDSDAEDIGDDDRWDGDDVEKLARDGADDEDGPGDEPIEDDSFDGSYEDDPDCAIAAGAFVRDAELELIDGELVFNYVELVAER